MRWVTLIVAIWALYRAYRGWLGGVFYCLPESMAQLAWTNLDAVMREPSLRFFVIEHSVQMVIALSLAHMGSALACRGRNEFPLCGDHDRLQMASVAL